MPRIGITSLHANPLHEGHLSLLRDAKSQCDILVVIINSDKQVLLRGSCPFLDETFRMELVQELECVDCVYLAIDEDGTVSKTLESVVNNYTSVYGIELIYIDEFDSVEQKGIQELNFTFFKGGSDRSCIQELPESEVKVCNDLNISIKFGCGGQNKMNSSSTALSRAFKWYIQQVNSGSGTAELRLKR